MDLLSPILFAIFFYQQLNVLKTGIDNGQTHLAIQMYADDVILLGESRGKAQTLVEGS